MNIIYSRGDDKNINEFFKIRVKLKILATFICICVFHIGINSKIPNRETKVKQIKLKLKIPSINVTHIFGNLIILNFLDKCIDD